MSPRVINVNALPAETLEITAARGSTPLIIALVQPGPFEVGPEAAQRMVARMHREADELWQALYGGLPNSTFVLLCEHFQSYAERGELEL